MNTLTADVTEVDGIRIGDEALVFGGPECTKGSLAETEQQFSTIMADLYADWGMRNARIFV